jgi:hypothetical protein
MLKNTDLGASSLGLGVDVKLASLEVSIKLILPIIIVEDNTFKLKC